MPKITGHPGVTIKKKENGTFHLGYVPVGQEDGVRAWVPARKDGQAVTNRRDAESLARELSKQLQKAKHLAPTVVERPNDPVLLRMRYSIAASIEEWLKTKSHEATRATNAYFIRRFREWCEENGKEFLDELTEDDGEPFHTAIGKMMSRRKDRAGQLLSPQKQDRIWSMTVEMLRWCCQNKRLRSNPFAGLAFKSYQPKQLRKLGQGITIVDRREREKLMAACQTDQERLMLLLVNYLGLRNGEVVNLKWRDYLSHASPKLITITAKPEVNWFPKNLEERKVPIIYPEVVEAIEHWRMVSPYPTSPDAWIFCWSSKAKRYAEFPRELIERLQEETGIDWTPDVGRHTAASILPHWMFKLTGERWEAIAHAKFFGHKLDTSEKYYIAQELLDLHALENLDSPPYGETGNSDEIAETRPNSTTWTPELARHVLQKLMDADPRSCHATAPIIGVSDTAIRKFLSGQTTSIPPWYFKALDELSKPSANDGRNLGRAETRKKGKNPSRKPASHS